METGELVEALLRRVEHAAVGEVVVVATQTDVLVLTLGQDRQPDVRAVTRAHDLVLKAHLLTRHQPAKTNVRVCT